LTKLKYKLTNDGLFKLLFVKYPDLLKRLVAELLGIPYESIEEFVITNPEMQPETLGGKFCRLDINMKVDGRCVDLEVQVEDEKDYVERSVFYWAKDFTAALPKAGDYVNLPPTIVISIIAFPLFGCAGFHSEFRLLEVTRHEPLTDKMCLHYFELPKIPKNVSKNDGLLLWLSLFGSETEEDIQKIQNMEVPIMEQVIEAYRHVSASDELRELERMRERARYNEAAALGNARREARQKTLIEIAKKMKADGAEVDYIVNMTGLTVDDILRL
jgi:predicted transposase/invertase (TIGR01784 family)